MRVRAEEEARAAAERAAEARAATERAARVAEDWVAARAEREA